MYPVHTVGRKAFTPAQTTRLGNVKDTWGDVAPVQSFGWFPGSTASPGSDTARNQAVEHVSLMLPYGTANAHRDKWVLGGVEYDQNGPAQDFSNGPWPTMIGGLVVPLIRNLG